MKALSIKQPWAHFIIHGDKRGNYKDVENRDWKTNLRGRVYVHAGKKVDTEAMILLQRTISPNAVLQLGGIIGTVEIVDCVSESDSQWFYGKYGFVLRNPKPLPFRPLRGQLGFFNVSGGTHEQG